MKLRFYVALATISCTAFGHAQAAASECGLSALVQGGGMVDSQNYSNRSGAMAADPHSIWLGGFGEVAAAYGCGMWKVQLDGAYHAFDTNKQYTAFSEDYQGRNGHFGGDVYWRDPNSFMLGLSASRILQQYTDIGPGSPKFYSGYWRGGVFGEYYPSENVTLGGGAYYFSGNEDFSAPDYRQAGFEGDLYAKYYASPNLSLSLRGDVLSSHYSLLSYFNTPLTGFAATAQAEYLVPNSSLSLFLGGRYANRRLDFQGSGAFENVADAQAFAGFSYSFGASHAASLRERDRTGTVDNTSLFNEKLPNFGMSSDMIQSMLAP